MSTALTTDNKEARELDAELRALRIARAENAETIARLREKLWERNYQGKVSTFMRAMDQKVPDAPTLEGYPYALRVELILEEAVEFAHACGFRPDEEGPVSELRNAPSDWPAMIDALCDLLYVTFGAASAMGIDLGPFFAEVHAANMRKLEGPIREDGKRLKPEGWKPPQIEAILAKLLEQSNA